MPLASKDAMEPGPPTSSHVAGSTQLFYRVDQLIEVWRSFVARVPDHEVGYVVDPGIYRGTRLLRAL